MHSLLNAGSIVNKFKPHAVIGTGGFASGPLLKRAAGKGVPCVLQEQNSYAGITNKLLAAKAKKICVAYDGMERYFPKDKIVKTGNPVRADLVDMPLDRAAGVQAFGLAADKKVLLVLGGSLGARRVNQLIAKELYFFKAQGVQLLWQCGKLYYQEYKKYGGGLVKVLPFIDQMDQAYAAADIIISRAGASSVSELCLVGKPVLFIPSPNVAEDHQTKNAQALAKEGAAVVLKEADLDAQFKKVFGGLLASEEEQALLGKNIKKMALPKATAHIVDQIEQLLG